MAWRTCRIELAVMRLGWNVGGIGLGGRSETWGWAHSVWVAWYAFKRSKCRQQIYEAGGLGGLSWWCKVVGHLCVCTHMHTQMYIGACECTDRADEERKRELAEEIKKNGPGEPWTCYPEIQGKTVFLYCNNKEGWKTVSAV